MSILASSLNIQPIKLNCPLTKKIPTSTKAFPSSLKNKTEPLQIIAIHSLKNIRTHKKISLKKHKVQTTSLNIKNYKVKLDLDGTIV
jgi:hypothetical protein